MEKAIHVLHVLGGVGLGGAESRIMDLYRQMDRERIQFDFLVHAGSGSDAGEEPQAGGRKPEFYDEEILSMGGHIYVLPKFKVYNYFSYKKAVRRFFERHREFRVVQGHMTSTAGIYLPIAKKAGAPVTVAHARNAGVVKGLKGIATRFFRQGLAGKADYCFACSTLAGQDVFGRDVMKAGRVQVIYNAIDVARFTYDEKKREEARKQLCIYWRFLRRFAKRGLTQFCFCLEKGRTGPPWKSGAGSLELTTRCVFWEIAGIRIGIIRLLISFCCLPSLRGCRACLWKRRRRGLGVLCRIPSRGRRRPPIW